MLEILKNPAAIVITIISVLLLVIRHLSKKVDTLQDDKAVAKIEKEVSDVKKEADQAAKDYEDAKRDFDQFKRDHPELFK